MSLSAYLRNGWIRPHERTAAQVSALLAVIDRDLEQASIPGLGPEWRFDIAYNAALQTATAALAACGYRAERGSKHVRTLECLSFTLGAPEDETIFLDVCRRKRHRAIYESAGSISDGEARELIDLAADLRARLLAWLAAEHPDLLS